jgi:hypothetical protein
MILLIYIQDTSSLSKKLLHLQLRNYKQFYLKSILVSPVEFPGYDGYNVEWRTELFPCKTGGAIVSIAQTSKEPIYYCNNNYLVFENPSLIETDSLVVSRYEIPYPVVDSKQQFVYRMRTKCFSNEEVFIQHALFKPETIKRYIRKDVGSIEEVLEDVLPRHTIKIHRYKGKWYYITSEDQLEAIGLRV